MAIGKSQTRENTLWEVFFSGIVIVSNCTKIYPVQLTNETEEFVCPRWLCQWARTQNNNEVAQSNKPTTTKYFDFVIIGVHNKFVLSIVCVKQRTHERLLLYCAPKQCDEERERERGERRKKSVSSSFVWIIRNNIYQREIEKDPLVARINRRNRKQHTPECWWDPTNWLTDWLTAKERTNRNNHTNKVDIRPICAFIY